jgi:hypothetical protein
MWIDILEAGSVENQKVTILNMLEYMGAWEWYDSQVYLVQASGKVLTKWGKPMDQKGAATYLLDKIQRSGKYIKSLGMLTLEGGDATIDSSSKGVEVLALIAVIVVVIVKMELLEELLEVDAFLK